MFKVSVSEEVIANMLSVVQQARGGLENAVIDLKRAYMQAGESWNDKKYKQLGDIIEKASRNILVIGCHLGEAKEKLKNLQKSIEEYINTGNIGGSNAGVYTRGNNSTPSRTLDSVINDFQHENWSTMDTDSRQHSISDLAECVVDDLQLTNPPSINYYYREPGEDGSISYGYYNSQNNTININTYTMDNARETADTVAHELRHAWQRERAANPTNDEDRALANNFRNYIRYEVSPRRYQSQPVEVDARNYASQIRNAIH